MMDIEREKEKKLLREVYSDYNPKLHDGVVKRYQKEVQTKQLVDFMKARGIL